MLQGLKEYVTQPMPINAKTVLIFILFMAVSIGSILLAFKSFAACCRFSKKNRVSLFNLLHIICYGLIVAYFSLKDTYLKSTPINEIPKQILIVIAVVIFIIPTLMNIIKCKLFYGIQYSIWQMLFSLIFTSLVYAIIGMIILAIAVFIGASTSATDSNIIWIANYNTNSFRIREVSTDRYIDDDGNYYNRYGDNYYNESGEVFYRTQM